MAIRLQTTGSPPGRKSRRLSTYMPFRVNPRPNLCISPLGDDVGASVCQPLVDSEVFSKVRAHRQVEAGAGFGSVANRLKRMAVEGTESVALGQAGAVPSPNEIKINFPGYFEFLYPYLNKRDFFWCRRRKRKQSFPRRGGKDGVDSPEEVDAPNAQCLKVDGKELTKKKNSKIKKKVNEVEIGICSGKNWSFHREIYKRGRENLSDQGNGIYNLYEKMRLLG